MSDQGTSFIPKSGVKTVQRVHGTRRIYLLAYISYIVFFTTLFALIGVYVYGAIVSRSLSSLKEQMVNEQKRFAVTDIESMRQLDKRISFAEELLNKSTAPSRIFADVENIVASDIYFSEMSYELLANNQFQLELTGQAQNFNQILSQERLLENSSILKDAEVVSYDYSVGEGKDNNLLGRATVTFIFSNTRDSSIIPYVPALDTVLTESGSGSTENVILNDTTTPSSSSATENTPVVGGDNTVTETNF